MRELIDFLSGNPIVLIILVGWLLSAVGNVMAKAAKKAAQEQAAQKRGGQKSVDESHMTVEQTRARESQVRARMPEPRTRPEPEQIASQIRKMMGLEDPQSQVVAAPERPETRQPPVPEPPRQRRGDLRDELARKRADRDRKSEERDQQRGGWSSPDRKASDERMGAGVRDRHLKLQLGERKTARTDRGQRSARIRAKMRVLDLTHPASMLIAREVLGPPRALEGWDR